jgi:hypothetical protein
MIEEKKSGGRCFWWGSKRDGRVIASLIWVLRRMTIPQSDQTMKPGSEETLYTPKGLHLDPRLGSSGRAHNGDIKSPPR